MRARVYRSAKRLFECKLLESGELVEATALGKLLKKGIVVGDFVQLSYDESTSEYQIDEVEERESEIFRILIRENKKKITAANCNLLVILMSVSKPAYKRGLVDRFLIRASQWGIKPIVVFNKMDQYEEDEFDLKFEEKRLSILGVDCFEISALQGEEYKQRFLEKGIVELKEALAKRTAIFLGQSGVGKSKTITNLSGGKVELKTKNVGKVGKGSHTTTWSEIIDLPLFSLIDSPGIRSFSLEDINPKDLIMYFPDIEEMGVNCKFKDCAHTENVKGCIFHSGQIDQEELDIYFSRLESYQRILEEIGQTPEWEKGL
ncbi:MAG: ribosome small subunit-dependent GTPase A [Oligoflexia bacterium]|nr:ribosome small subunit-dependent GTPase A [Oligoflexia bacterium]